MASFCIPITTPFHIFFVNDPATTEIYTLSLHDALPIPCSSRQRSTVSGAHVVLTPSASSTSALPQGDVAAREPCFATGTPAPAMTKAAAVETLNVFARLDPVPAVSMRRV